MHKAIPDALPIRAENDKSSLYETMQTAQSKNDLSDLLDRTAKQVIEPNQVETQRTFQHQRNETL